MSWHKIAQSKFTRLHDLSQHYVSFYDVFMQMESVTGFGVNNAVKKLRHCPFLHLSTCVSGVQSKNETPRSYVHLGCNISYVVENSFPRKETLISHRKTQKAEQLEFFWSQKRIFARPIKCPVVIDSVTPKIYWLVFKNTHLVLVRRYACFLSYLPYQGHVLMHHIKFLRKINIQSFQWANLI